MGYLLDSVKNFKKEKYDIILCHVNQLRQGSARKYF